MSCAGGVGVRDCLALLLVVAGVVLLLGVDYVSRGSELAYDQAAGAVVRVYAPADRPLVVRALDWFVCLVADIQAAPAGACDE